MVRLRRKMFVSFIEFTTEATPPPKEGDLGGGSARYGRLVREDTNQGTE